MYRYVDMAMHNPAQADNLDSLFGCQGWRDLILLKDHDERAEQTIGFFSDQLRARFVTHMYMRADNGVLKYVLLHATNHGKGREQIREAMWSVTPDGSFAAFERDDPSQLVLVCPEPDLNPLRARLWKRFSGQAVRMNEIYDWLLDQLYLNKHLHTILRSYRRDGHVEFSGYDGKFAFSKNPVVSFPSKPPEGSKTRKS